MTTRPIDGPLAALAQPNNGAPTAAAAPAHSNRRRERRDAAFTGEDSLPRRLCRVVRGNRLDLLIVEAFGDLMHDRCGQRTAAVAGHRGDDAIGRHARQRLDEIAARMAVGAVAIGANSGQIACQESVLGTCSAENDQQRRAQHRGAHHRRPESAAGMSLGRAGLAISRARRRSTPWPPGHRTAPSTL
ncbi:MAG TPA: hypothetical protein VGJ35_04720, partial [Burkholderiaceae bacterium]